MTEIGSKVLLLAKERSNSQMVTCIQGTLSKVSPTVKVSVTLKMVTFTLACGSITLCLVRESLPSQKVDHLTVIGILIRKYKAIWCSMMVQNTGLNIIKTNFVELTSFKKRMAIFWKERMSTES